MLQNNFENVTFESDSVLYLAGVVRVVAYAGQAMPRVIKNRYTLFRYVIPKDELSCIPVSVTDYSPQPMTWSLEYAKDRGSLLVASANMSAVAGSVYSHAWTLSEYSRDGHRIRNVMRIPYAHFASGLGYNNLQIAIDAPEGGEIVALGSTTPAIFRLDRGDSINLSDPSWSNDSMFQANRIVRTRPDSAARLQKVQFRHVTAIASDTLFVCAQERSESTNEWRWIACEFDGGGKARGRWMLAEEGDERIRGVTFRRDGRDVWAVASDDNGWYLYSAKWK